MCASSIPLDEAEDQHGSLTRREREEDVTEFDQLIRGAGGGAYHGETVRSCPSAEQSDAP